MTKRFNPRVLMRHTSAGAVFAATFLAPLMLGYWIDGKTHTRPGFMLLGGTIGFAVGLWRLIHEARDIQRDASPPQEPQDSQEEGGHDAE